MLLLMAWAPIVARLVLVFFGTLLVAGAALLIHLANEEPEHFGLDGVPLPLGFGLFCFVLAWAIPSKKKRQVAAQQSTISQSEVTTP
jgi:hypothetical protein